MYQALYRKWRPKTFSDVIGQAHVTETLQRQVAEGRTSHAYLFTGTRGTGKTSCAKILAKAVNCEHPVNGNPCNTCPSCLGIENGSFLDVLELDAASNNGVDQVRALRDEAVYSPAHVKKRVYIIDEVHMLSLQAFNALLKILEEPPAHLMFILATTELHKVPPTILSRCQRFSFRRITPQDIAARLSYVAAQEKLDLTPDGAELLSRLADGALRDALSLLDQCAAADGVIDGKTVLEVLGLAGNLQTSQLMGSVLRRDTQEALLLFHQLYIGGKDVGAVLSELSTLTRDLLLRKTAPEGGTALLSGGFDGATLDRLSQGLSSARLIYLASTLQQASADLYYSSNRRTDAELCLLRLCDETLSGDLTALAARMTRLEDAVLRGQETSPMRAGKSPAVSSKPAPAPKTALAEPLPDPPPWEEPPEEPVTAEEQVPWEESPLQEPATISVPPAVPRPSTPQPSEGQSSSSAADDIRWPELAESCKGQLPMMYRAFLDHCRGSLEEDLLTVFAPDDITKNRLDNDRVLSVLQETASRSAGRPVRVHLAVGAVPETSPSEKMQNLIQFGSQFDSFTVK